MNHPQPKYVKQQKCNWIENKVCGISVKSETKEPEDFIGIDIDDHEYLKYTYELEHNGSDSHDKVQKYQDCLQMQNAIYRK